MNLDWKKGEFDIPFEAEKNAFPTEHEKIWKKLNELNNKYPWTFMRYAKNLMEKKNCQ